MNNVAYESELYFPMKTWLQEYLENKYHTVHVEAIDSHAFTLDKVLEKYGVLDQYPQTVGLDIEIDVLGIVRTRHKSKIAFIEAKKTNLNIHDLGQITVYCKLCDPAEAFLFSSAGMGSLNKILKNLHRVDLLDYGDQRSFKKVAVAKWDIQRNAPDYMTMIPRLD